MPRKNKTEAADAENPEWNDAMFKKARKGSDVIPELFDQKTASSILRPRGRPKSAVTKQQISIRLSADVLEYFKSSGRGWQTRIDETLRDAAEL